MRMPNIRDVTGEGNVVILHSEIRDVHRLAADVDYFLRARMLCTLSLRNKYEQITPSKSEEAGRRHRIINNENEQNCGQYKANANAGLLLSGHDDDNDVRDCWKNSTQV